MKWSRLALLLFVFAVVNGSAAFAQGTNARASNAQFDVAASFYEALTSGTTGNGTKQTPTNSVGGMIEARYLINRLAGFGMSYSYNRADATYAPNGTTYATCGLTCANPVTKLSGFADEISLDWVPSMKIGNLRPFAIGGLGFFITSPANNIYDVNTVVRPVYVVGGGLDWTVIGHFGVRLQYRDNIYKAPDPLQPAGYPPTGVFTSSSEPTGGIFYRF